MLTALRAVHPVVQKLYGIRIRTPWPVRGVIACDDDWDVEFVADQHDALAQAASCVPDEQKSRWAQYVARPDGSAYRRWRNLCEFLVSADARRIYARALREGGEDEAMLAYLLVDALSFSMVRLGREPLHATAVLTDRGVVAFLGNSGDGKSTLAALLMRHRCQLLTDDMLVLVRDRGTWLAQPGPPRLKLYRNMADHILDSTRQAVPMNTETQKLIIPLDASECVTEANTLKVIYILNQDVDRRQKTPEIRRLPPGAAFPRVLAHTAGHYPSDATRLRRQFDFATMLVQNVPIKTLSYRREKAEMAGLRDAVLADVACAVE